MNKLWLEIGQGLDLGTDLFIKISGIILALRGQLMEACICFGMSALWSMCCFGVKKYTLDQELNNKLK